MPSKDARALELVSQGDTLFTDKRQLDSLNQEVAWHFCPDLANFTTKLLLGQDFAIDRMDSYPEQVSRELSNQTSAMMRPSDRAWFKTTTLNAEIDADEECARYLEYVNGVMRQGIYDPRTKFIRATKITDRFFINFGMAVLGCYEAPTTRDHLFFRSFHLKDCAWLENEIGDIDNLHRKEMITARKLVREYKGDRLSQEVKDAAEKNPSQEFEIRVIVMPSDEYDATAKTTKSERDGKKLPFVACYVDAAHGRVIKEAGMMNFPYIVPRWNMFAESQYAFSPCAMLALPDARMAQMMNQILLEAGEKAIDPPLIAKAEVVIGEPAIEAGGISWVDIEHDQSLKEALDAIKIDPDMKVGFAMRQDLREMLAKAFFLDKLNLPEAQKDMTAYEVGRRLEEHIRNLLPLFEPMQIEYNVRLLDKVYETLSNMKKFRVDGTGPLIDGGNGIPPLPRQLNNFDITWAFQSPIQDAMDRILVEDFKGALELVGLGTQAGISASPLNPDIALRDALRGAGIPASWRKTQAELAAEKQQNDQQKQLMSTLMAASQGAHVAGQIGDAAGKAGDAGQKLGLMPPQDQKAVQGNARGAPDVAGEQGLPAPDVGDRGPAQGPNAVTPAPWQPQQPQDVLSAALAHVNQPQGATGAPGAPQGASAPQPQDGGPPVTQLTPQGPSLMDVMYALRRLAAENSALAGEIADLKETIAAPREITVKRNTKDKISGATLSVKPKKAA